MRKILLVVNPCSGKKKAVKALAEIISVFNRAACEVSVHLTAARAEATELVRQRAQDFDIVACAGGDGTFNEVVSGVITSGAACSVGYIPAGSTNDFANSLGLSKDLVQAARDIVSGETRRYDIGCFGGRYFSYVASFGAFTRTSYATSQNVKNMLGHLAYILGGIKELPSIHSYAVSMQTDGGQIFSDSYIFGAISNSTSVGGILTLDPEVVDMNDGLFELLLIRKPKNAKELAECVMALTRQKYDSPMITFCPARSVTVRAEAGMDWTLDGEHEAGHETVLVENIHDAIQMIVPDLSQERADQ